MDAEPDLPTARLYQDILAGRFPPAGALPTVSLARRGPNHNLPLQLTSFIGREKEKAQIQRLLNPRSDSVSERKIADRGHSVRLLTLTGSDGCGKTRLALKAASAIESLIQAEAVQLFVERAQIALPGFALTKVHFMFDY